MRRQGMLVALTSGALLYGAAVPALADQEITAQTGNRFSAATYTMDQGEKLTFRNGDPLVMHDVTSTATGDVKGHLFASDTIGSGTSFVEGSQYLTAGSYEFYCSVHPDSMKATLTVSSNGTPVPRPGTGGGGTTPPPPDTTAPSLTLTASKQKAKTVKRDRQLKLTIGTSEGSTLKVSVKLGTKRAGSLSADFLSEGTRKVLVDLKGKVARKLKRGSRLSVTLTGTDTAGNAAAPIKLFVKLR